MATGLSTGQKPWHPQKVSRPFIYDGPRGREGQCGMWYCSFVILFLRVLPLDILNSETSGRKVAAAGPAPLRLAVRGNAKVAVAIVHEDADLFVVDKPAGMVTQPGKGHTTDSLLNALFALKDGAVGKQLHNLGVRRDYGLLHRLDKETSGLLVVAKSPNAYDQLRRDFEARKIDKEYLTMTAGIPSPLQGVVQARLKEVEVPNPDSRRGGRLKRS